jgi:hypothetical protein
MPRPRHLPFQGDHVKTSALAKPAAAITLAALAAFGTAACSAGAPGKAADAKSSRTASPSESGRPTPSTSPAPQAGTGTKLQCLALEGKLMGSAAELQSAMGTLNAGGDPSAALGPLQSVQKDLDDEIGSVTDPALKGPAAKLKTDFDTLVATVKAASDAYAAKNVSAAQAQAAKLQPQKAALEADATALQKLCA